jgi:hypothetical protein
MTHQHVLVLEELLAEAKRKEAQHTVNTKAEQTALAAVFIKHEEDYQQLLRLEQASKRRLERLRKDVTIELHLLEEYRSNACQCLSDMSEEHMSWRNSRAHAKDGVNNQ